MADRHPLIVLLQIIRQRHKVSQLDVEICMQLPINTLRHIEKGRRVLPSLEHGLAGWVKRFLTCVSATEQERQEVIELMSRQILLELSELLENTPDVERADQEGN